MINMTKSMTECIYLIDKISNVISAIDLFRTVKQSNHNTFKYRVVSHNKEINVPGVIYVSNKVRDVNNGISTFIYHIDVRSSSKPVTLEKINDAKEELRKTLISFFKFNNVPDQTITMGGSEFEDYLNSYRSHLEIIRYNLKGIVENMTLLLQHDKLKEGLMNNLDYFKRTLNKMDNEEEANKIYNQKKAEYIQIYNNVRQFISELNLESMTTAIETLCHFVD